MVAASAAAEVLDALRGYGWIALAAVVIWRLFPVIRKRIERDDISLESGGRKVTFKNASEQWNVAIKDLQDKYLSLLRRLEEQSEGDTGEGVAAPTAVSDERTRILWVDDHPENNAFLVKSLRDREADVVEVTSTDECLAALTSNPTGFDIVISDMSRTERGGENELAGVDLVVSMKNNDLTIPVLIYASPRAIERGGEEALRRGAVAATSSPTELLSMIRLGPTTEFEADVADIVRHSLNARSVPVRRTVDFIAQRDGERIGIEIKNWSSNPRREEYQRVLRRLEAVRTRFGLDRIVVITKNEVEPPKVDDRPEWIDVMTAKEFAQSVASE